MTPTELEYRFLRKTGYGPRDILSLSYHTKTFLTRNGGKYQIRKNKVIHISGPDANPNLREI